ncbi:hypothetical protein [Vreelandella boliviensis]|uniref:Uncharacterized protein n=2 Tax=Vreelandella boliviensis TaxID=223527 RepID=A0A7U9C0W6_9GAMM|nr:hypothetical protein [Halomonas boliviensis]EHJ93053.1 hypothetical protein KUC_3015 [Halomonas boliviensis LC1]
MSQQAPGLPQPDTAQPHQAGETQSIPGGRITYLAPEPLPTGHQALDLNGTISTFNETWLDVGGGYSAAFGWQLMIGVIYGAFLLCAVVFPSIAWLTMLDASFNFMWDTYMFFFWIGLAGGGACFLAMYSGHWTSLRRLRDTPPVRFHRQRREVCFVLEGTKDTVIVPWESLMAWVVEARGVTQYGVQQQFGMGFGYAHPETGQWLKLEFMTMAKPLAISHWEAVRAYMEYEVNSLAEVQDPNVVRGKDDPPWEGVHTLRNARRHMNQRRADGEIGWLYWSFWYLIDIVQLWNLPGYLTEWDNKRLMKARPNLLPSEMVEWSKPLPEEQWARPSEELTRLSEAVRTIREQDPALPIEMVFTEAYKRQGLKA